MLESLETYTTVLGDMWDIIAKKRLGSELYMDKLIAANPKYAATVIFSAGVVLTIPDISLETSVNLPPWKR